MEAAKSYEVLILLRFPQNTLDDYLMEDLWIFLWVMLQETKADNESLLFFQYYMTDPFPAIRGQYSEV